LLRNGKLEREKKGIASLAINKRIICVICGKKKRPEFRDQMSEKKEQKPIKNNQLLT
jgi:hypothetical protein